MVGHNDIPEQNHALIFNAEIKTVQDDIPKVLSAKNIDPIHNSTSDEVWFFLISDHVAGFHTFCFYQR